MPGTSSDAMRTRLTPPWKIEVRAETSSIVRIRRIAALLAHLMAVWFGSRFVLPLVKVEQRRRIASRWASRMLRILNLKVSTAGCGPSSTQPMLLVANHISWLDMYVLNSIEAWRFVAKSDVAGWPVIGTMARQLLSIFHERGNFRDAMRVKNLVAEHLTAGERIAFFPEGTTTEGRRIEFFYPALFQAALDARAMVQPVAIRYLDARGVPTAAPAYAGETTLLESIAAVLRHHELTAELTFTIPLAATDFDRRTLAEAARTSIAEVLDVRDLPPRPRTVPWAPEVTPRANDRRAIPPRLRPSTSPGVAY